MHNHSTFLSAHPPSFSQTAHQKAHSSKGSHGCPSLLPADNYKSTPPHRRGPFPKTQSCRIAQIQSKAKTDDVLGIRHRDLVEYTFKNGEKHIGYVTALYPEMNALNFQSQTKHCKKVNAKKCRLLWKYNKIYWLESAV